ncbi:MAG TPA: hypothetical protein VGM39_13675 [Kofleriaceae bacterium]
MWWSNTEFLITIAVVWVAVLTPAFYALFLARRGLRAYRTRRLLEGRTLAWHHLGVAFAFLGGATIAVMTFGMINLVVLPAAIIDVIITTRNQRIDRKMRRELGLPLCDEPQQVLPRAYVVGHG